MAERFQRYFENADMRMLAYAIGLLNLLLYTLTLTGCMSTSPGIPNLYTAKLQINDTEIRIGLFGMCYKAQSFLACASTIGKSPSQVVLGWGNSLNATILPSNLQDTDLPLAVALQNKLLISLLAPAGIFFLMAMLSLLMLKRSSQKSGRTFGVEVATWRYMTLIGGFLSVALALSSVYSTTLSLNAARFFLARGMSTTALSVGPAVQVLQWFIVSLSIVFQGMLFGLADRVGFSTSPSVSLKETKTKKGKKKSKNGIPPPPPPPPDDMV